MSLLRNTQRRPALGKAAPGFSAEPGAVRITISGEWSIHSTPSDPAALLEEISPSHPQKLSFDCQNLVRYDSSLPVFLLKLHRLCTGRGIDFDMASLPSGVARLLELALARPKSADAEHSALVVTFFHRVGQWGRRSVKSWDNAFSFTGEVTIAFWNLFRGRARTRFAECWQLIQSCGADALPIVSLISFLTGLILAYVGAVQMQQFGATIYVASLVGLAMVREMGVLMASVILCGRTATAYAAQLGSMQASEEIAAFRVLGINPVEYLVLPRIIALFFMLPLLTLYANFCGMLGGMVVVTSMDISFEQYYNMTIRSINLPNFSSGLIKSFFFAILIAWAGCFRGIISGRSAQAVGDATTSAAVLSITLIVIADAIFAVLFNAIHFF